MAAPEARRVAFERNEMTLLSQQPPLPSLSTRGCARTSAYLRQRGPLTKAALGAFRVNTTLFAATGFFTHYLVDTCALKKQMKKQNE